MTNLPPAALSIEAVSKSFGSTSVLDRVGFEVPEGQFVTLLGPSGCGKTTLMRIIAGLELPDAGKVIMGGVDVSMAPANRRAVNTVFQSYALFPHLSVYENIAFGLRARKIDRAEIATRVSDALEMLQIGPFAARQPHQLSGGQRQRVALARALVNQPEVLLLDEPMSALDAKLRADVQVELRRLQRKLGKTFILVTHDQDEAMTVSDRILVMNKGKIEQDGPPMEVYEQPRSRFVAEFLGSANLITASRNCSGVETQLGHLDTARRPAWEAGTVAIRPERIKVVQDRPANNGLKAIVRDLIYRGDHLDLWVEPGPLRVRTHPTQRLDAGDEVWLELPAESVSVLED